MDKTDVRYKEYIKLLKTELVPAMGCTEPISLAYAAATAKEVLGEMPISVKAYVSGNIVKNVKSVIVPNTNGAKGIPAAIASGIVAGKPCKKLEVLSEVSSDEILKINEFVKNVEIEVNQIDDHHVFDIQIYLYSKKHSSYVRIVDSHTNIVEIKKDDKIVEFDKSDMSCIKKFDDSFSKFVNEITIEEIYDFATTCDVCDVKEILDRQINYNMAIANEGMKNNYGANIGKTLIKTYGDGIYTKVKAYASAGSDARMNGCELPVIINSGSGNQGMTASIPVIVFAQSENKTAEELYRALLISNLSTIHIKTGIGKLSAYCGAVAAGCGSGAGICYLSGGDLKAICHTLVNAIAITSGIVCDGAKASCAAKIASSVDAGLLGYFMYKNGNQFRDGDGIVKKGVENTINSVSKLASIGMCETDKEIIKIMLDK